MKVFFLLAFLGVVGIYDLYAQSTTQDSLDVIERQRRELRDQQARLKAKQDSLVIERLRIEQQQNSQRQQELQKQQELLKTQQQPQVIYQQPAAVIPQRYVKNIVGLVPVHMFITGVEVFYERAISKKNSLQWNIGYHNMEKFPDTYSNGTINTNNTSSSAKLGTAFLPDKDKVACSGFRIQMQYKSYIFQEVGVLRKLHIGPSLLYKQDEMTIMTNYNSSTSISYTPIYEQFFAQAITGAVDVGYNIKFLRFFSLDPFVGFSYTVPLTGKVESNKVNVDFINPYKQGLLLRTGVTIGYTF
jgi:hypothetical protein